MRYIDLSLIDENDPDVKAWLQKAQRCLLELSQQETHAERTKYLNKHNIWSEFKPILYKYYGEKCWYSECSLEGAYGDVDHFRPKNKSTTEQGKTILKDGYWWLAYDYLNYRLSCEKSNRGFKKGGKKNSFPLKTGTNPAGFPDKNDIPLLLDPCKEQDTDLIDCDETGTIIALSEDPEDIERVRLSSCIYNWNLFNAGRKSARIQCQSALKYFEMTYESDDYAEKMPDALENLCRMVNAQNPYSSFSRKYLELKIQKKPYEGIIKQVLQLL